ncbi:acyltransferase family protein [Saccharibacillus sp. JS10]|uniref:acyltransferase family protein n=1 Tax=Saccharibacillus sp. JS10 TaxID=2950552 RepID=UPI00210ED755|nr:acyltransferase family protein [Saccharibacillus sp. JS10]MCQ4087637.1 acyltransferase family protein [Saccharibacillus sp. JS10]
MGTNLAEQRSLRNIGGTDWLKFMAALLVIANHTSPLASISPQADFLIAGLISRVAVPIFFIGSGFFLFRKFVDNEAAPNRSIVIRYTNKIALLYGFSILLYLPLNVYKGDFAKGFDFVAFLRDLLLDGTFYHLWFFPALWMGIWLIYFLSRLSSPVWAWVAATALYVFGLLGDSYYGFATNMLHLKPIYGALYSWMDYTRNGLFFAPLPILAGAALARRNMSNSIPSRAVSFRLGLASIIALLLLIAEGEWLHSLNLPRHDSMYVFSIPAAFLLFLWSTTWNVHGSKRLRAWRTWVYILHPLAIVLVRGAAEVVKGEQLLIANSPVHYIAVCLLSIGLSAFAAAATSRISKLILQTRTKKREEDSSSAPSQKLS